MNGTHAELTECGALGCRSLVEHGAKSEYPTSLATSDVHSASQLILLSPIRVDRYVYYIKTENKLSCVLTYMLHYFPSRTVFR